MPLKVRIRFIVAKIRHLGSKDEVQAPRHLGNENFDQWVIPIKPKR